MPNKPPPAPTRWYWFDYFTSALLTGFLLCLPILGWAVLITCWEHIWNILEEPGPWKQDDDEI